MQQQRLSGTSVGKMSAGYAVPDERLYKDDHDVDMSAAVSVDVNSGVS